MDLRDHHIVDNEHYRWLQSFRGSIEVWCNLYFTYFSAVCYHEREVGGPGNRELEIWY